MGVPSFFKWLTLKYPKVLIDCLEEKEVNVQGHSIPIQLSDPNPNGVEYDCLYIDMNGLVHPCCHPEGKEQPKSEHEMMMNVFKEIDRLFAAIRPRKLIYLAIDGVAPRAKMNQQRSRRFRSAQEAEDTKLERNKLRQEMIDSGLRPPPRGQEPWDSNVITPGTPFMAKLTAYLRWYVHDRITNLPAWQNINVILSDSSAPGEGEHKIFEFVRLMRNEPGYNPNWRHVIHGLDADLIMLALATHEAHFYILREQVIFGKRPPQKKAMTVADLQASHKKSQQSSKKQGKHHEFDGNNHALLDDRKPLQFVKISIMREYLTWEFRPESFPTALPFEHDIERIIDDFILLCCFVGNDFLPHLPSMSIREGALDLMLILYRQHLPAIGGYLTDSGSINLRNASIILGIIGEKEDRIFKIRKSKEAFFKRRREQENQTKRADLTGSRSHLEARTREAAEAAKQSVGLVALTSDRIARGKRDKALSLPSSTSSSSSSTHTRFDDKADDDDDILMPSIDGDSNETDAKDGDAKDEEDEDEDEEEEEEEVVEEKKNWAKLTVAKLKVELKARDLPIDGKKAVLVGRLAENDAAISSKKKKSSKKKSSKARKKETKKRKREDKKEEEEEDDDEQDEAAMSGMMSLLDNTNDTKSATKTDDTFATGEEEDLSEEMADNFKEILKGTMKAKQIHEDVEDNVRLGETGWKDRYYTGKFGDKIHEENFCSDLWKSYVKGLCWVVKYYYVGCPSWSWYYPYHYAPFASDLRSLEQYGPIEFGPSAPFTPFEQLMGVLPANSSHCLPEPCQKLMTSPTSPILDFYPKEFELDPNGEAMTWKWIALLPFIDAHRLQKNVKLVSNMFDDEQIERNRIKSHVVLVHRTENALGRLMESKLSVQQDSKKNFKKNTKKTKKDATTEGESTEKVDDAMVTVASLGTHFIAGTMTFAPDDLHTYSGAFVSPSDVKCSEIQDLTRDLTMEVYYDMPERKKHFCGMMPGVVPPEPELTQADRLAVRRTAFRGKNSITDLAANPGNHGASWGSMEPKKQRPRHNNYQQGGGQPSGTTNGPPPGYICKICNVAGHFIQHCPQKAAHNARKSQHYLHPRPRVPQNNNMQRSSYPPRPLYQQQYNAPRPQYQQQYGAPRPRFQQQYGAPRPQQYQQQYQQRQQYGAPRPQFQQYGQPRPLYQQYGGPRPPQQQYQQQHNPFMGAPPPLQYQNMMPNGAPPALAAPLGLPPPMLTAAAPPTAGSNQAALATLRAQLLAAHQVKK